MCQGYGRLAPPLSTITQRKIVMINVEKASSIYAKLCAGERITADEREELEEYAKRFSNKSAAKSQDQITT